MKQLTSNLKILKIRFNGLEEFINESNNVMKKLNIPFKFPANIACKIKFICIVFKNIDHSNYMKGIEYIQISFYDTTTTNYDFKYVFDENVKNIESNILKYIEYEFSRQIKI